MSSLFLRSSCFALGAWLAACGSDPLSSSDADDAGRGGSGGTSASGANGGSSGSGTRGGSGGSSAGSPTIPDYAASPCYGDVATTRVYDVNTHETPEVQVTCRAEGERTRVYVADALWERPLGAGASVLNQAEINAFMYGYEVAGNADGVSPGLGVLPTDELVFGELPASALTDGKLPIFIVDSGGAGEGYLCSWCDRTELHLDGPLLGSLHTAKALSIAAHETFHAIHRGYDANESVWVDETLAEAAMTANGYYTDQEWLGSFLQNTNIEWGPTHDDPRRFNYGAGLLYGTYLFERGGSDLMRAITREPLDSWAGIDAALESVGDSANGYELFQSMALAILLDDDESYGFRSFDIAGGGIPSFIGAGDSYEAELAPYGILYVMFEDGANGFTLGSSASTSAQLVFAGSPPQINSIANGERVEFEEEPLGLVLTSKTRVPVSLLVH